MGRCRLCQREYFLISKYPGVCLDCIRKEFERVKPYIFEAHAKTRKDFNLPFRFSRETQGILCTLCINECRIGEDERGFCGLRGNLRGKLIGANSRRGSLSFYFDSLPTNCVASWVCPGGSKIGFPKFSYKEGPEYGYKNLAVFYNGCSFNCLFCQNWNFRDTLRDIRKESFISPQDLAEVIDDKTSCICYFGGDPVPQLPHSILTSKIALKKRRNKILRICCETNGSMNKKLLRQIVKIALDSGGCIKFDLKAWSESLHIALCGVSNRRTLENFAEVSKYIKERPSPPLLIASTLLIPGYIDEYEIENISKFIASLNREIPYSLLAFYPCFYMNELPITSRSFALKAKEIASNSGLKNIWIGNIHLLS